MPSNSIGKNNALVGVCLDKRIKSVLGREALAEDRSLANFIFNAAMQHWRAHRTDIAQAVEAIKKGAAVVLCFFTISGELCSRFDTHPDSAKRRASRQIITTRRTKERFEFNELEAA